MEDNNMDIYFGSIGIGFPKDEQQLANFNRTYQDFEFEGNENVIDPIAILQSIRPITNIDYHKRTVLAAEIVFQLQKEVTIGHLKIQKLMYLCQHTAEMSLHTNFLKQAMGPYDPAMMRSIDKKFVDNKWFRYTPGNFPLYKPMERVGGHKTWYKRYFESEIPAIDRIIDIFRRVKGEKVELVATIYDCVLQAKKRKQIISDNLIVNMVYAWSDHKEKFRVDTIKKAHAWMQEEGIYPI